MRTLADTIKALPSPSLPQLPAPPYTGTTGDPKVGLAVKSMQHHTSDEGWVLFAGLEAAGYDLAGANMLTRYAELGRLQGFQNLTDVRAILEMRNPGTVVLQDKREYEGRTAGPGFDRKETFTNVGALKDRNDIWKVTVLKDAHQYPEYHRNSAEEIGCHAWITYYHPTIVHHLAPWTRTQHLIRTYHTVDAGLVPNYTSDERHFCLISGARLPKVYPLRERLWLSELNIGRLAHPGYGRQRCFTPDYLRTLSRYKVAICTSSIYGYAIRKIVEATACGCMVVTDLPIDDVLPGIDANLVRISTDLPIPEIKVLLERLAKEYEPRRQKQFAEIAMAGYDYRVEGRRLAAAIEKLRREYNDPT